MISHIVIVIPFPFVVSEKVIFPGWCINSTYYSHLHLQTSYEGAFRVRHVQQTDNAITIFYSKVRGLFDQVQLKSIFVLRLVCDCDLHVIFIVWIFLNAAPFMMYIDGTQTQYQLATSIPFPPMPLNQSSEEPNVRHVNSSKNNAADS